MTRNVIEAVNRAREFFDIKEFPGDFFTLLEKDDYIQKYNLILFKEDIGKLSGFIGYGEGDIAVICINYQRPIGHQNFTLAHELGHWFMHKGQSLSDDDTTVGFSKDLREQEANDFARELLYPEKLFINDFFEVIKRDLLLPENRAELGKYVDELCHQYCVSFEMVLRRILYSKKMGTQYKAIRKEIEKALGCKISEAFDTDFYKPNDELICYQQLMKPYEELEKRVDKLVSLGKIGEATAESIKFRNGIGTN